MSWTVMPTFDDYDRAREEFEWDLPDDFNPAVDFLRKHDDTSRVALRYERPGESDKEDGNGDSETHSTEDTIETYTFDDLDDRSDRLAAALADLGVEAGDRVGVVVPQKPQNPITHLANWKLGAVSVPLTVLFGRDALQYRLEDSEATAVVVDPSVRGTIEEIRDECPALESVIELGTADSVDGDAYAFDELLASHEPGIEVYDATPETPSAIMYTSGSTGPPKGVLHSHALWLGRAAAAYNYFEQGLAEGEATLWTPADWAWGAALGGTLFAAWHHGCTIVGWPREGFDPEAAYDLMERHGVTKAFMPPTALRMLMGVDDPEGQFDLALETFASAGEPLTPEVVDWVQETFANVGINDFYGQTELNLVVGNSSWFETRPGSMGKPFPGYEVAILDPDSEERVPEGEVGELAVKPDDRRVFFNEYWGFPEKTAAKQTESGWFRTGDLVERDDEGYLWFVSRTDDVILTSGYRVGPMEVEEAILHHDAVEQVGVVGVPDETRGEAIKAFVQPATAVADAAKLREEIRTLVRERLAEYEYPQEIEFVDELPTTTTGKIRRRSLRD
ncbi:acyl-CoA synthetase [Natrialba magadii ATCC 43099]|uniref:Acyl-CoA synthetase n=2 Tax=Natrialba magadii (strain ATCC 43099 / DSM 3394 / CCM 3739 / CIP 104546 / IAM 13178 / JCM 8861 / NBRC 102185 / NCIMB 2190 / MS3) TaxID=547559 RepID=D3T063_NATMM|nr:AMP-binding protein [Natrialba magadii]ADD04421.1 acyl-CoA synthetase [Natrialba magadii ATCC 43099]